MRERIPLPMADDTRLLMGLSPGDAGVLFGGVAASLALVAPHNYGRWPWALATGVLTLALLGRWQEEPLWAWAVCIVKFYASPRRFRFDIPSEVNIGETSRAATLSAAGNRKWHVPHGS